MNLDIATLEHLTTVIRALPRSQSHEPTFMQIAGYPHLENVATSILYFFLQPANPHGFGAILLEAFLTFCAGDHGFDPRSVAVHREVTTSGGKRIDLLVETSNLVLAIENKIYHTVINPLRDYRRHLETISQGRSIYGIVLALWPPETIPDGHGFQPISYQALFHRLRERFGGCLLSAREPYLTFFRDFVRTITDLTEDTTMNTALLAYFRDHRADIEALLAEVDSLRSDMRRKTRQMAAILDTTMLPERTASGFFGGAPRLYEILWYNVDISDSIGLQINVNLSPVGWRINMHNSKGDQLHHRVALESWLGSHGIVVKPRGSEPRRLGYGSDTIDYHGDVPLVQQEVQELFQKVSQAMKAG